MATVPGKKKSCRVKFKGKEMNFSGCARDKLGIVEVFWNVREEENEIDTLFRARTEDDYVSFGWGHSKALPSKVAIAFKNPSGQAYIDEYVMPVKTSGRAQLLEIPVLSSTEVEVRGKLVSGLFTRKLQGYGLPEIVLDRATAVWAVGSRPDSSNSVSKPSVSGEIVLNLTNAARPDRFERRPCTPCSPIDTELNCKVRFKGRIRTFAACKKLLFGRVQVYWNIIETSNDTQIETLFRAQTFGGYAGFSWGYSEMIGSNAAVAYLNKNGEPTILEYSLPAKSSRAVQPATVRSMENLEADLQGPFVVGYFTRKLELTGFPSLQIGKETAIWAVGPPPLFAPSLSVHVVRDISVFDLSIGLPPNSGLPSVPGDPVISPFASPEIEAPSASPEEVSESVCSVTFRGQQLNFSRCVLSGLGDVQVYWDVTESENEIDTLFRAPANGGYVSFGWGYTEMIGSNVAVAFQDESGAGVISEYAMTAKDSAGVQPIKNGSLTNAEVDIDSEFVAGRFTRALLGSDLPSLESDLVPAIWAIGPQPRSPTSLAYHGESRRGTGQIDFTGTSTAADPFSPPIVVSSPSPIPSAQPPTGGTFVSNGTCLISFKGEKLSYNACERLTLGIELFWRIREGKDGDEIDTLFRGPSQAGYISFGWGYDEMVGSNVVTLVQLKNGDVSIQNYFMSGQDTEDVQPASRKSLTNLEVEANNEGRFLAGTFTRKMVAPGLPPIRNGIVDAIWAVGEKPDSPNELSYHTREGRDRGSINIATGSYTLRSRFGAALKVHGALMATSFLVLVPTAILGIRYFQEYNPIAFQVHRALNITAITMVLAAFIIGVEQGNREETAHLVIGIIVMSFAFTQIASGIIPPLRNGLRRSVWYFVHMPLGYTVVGLAYANVWIGLSIIDAGDGFYIACGIVTGLTTAAFIALALMPKRFPPRGQLLRKDLHADEESPDLMEDSDEIDDGDSGPDEGGAPREAPRETSEDVPEQDPDVSPGEERDDGTETVPKALTLDKSTEEPKEATEDGSEAGMEVVPKSVPPEVSEDALEEAPEEEVREEPEKVPKALGELQEKAPEEAPEDVPKEALPDSVTDVPEGPSQDVELDVVGAVPEKPDQGPAIAGAALVVAAAGTGAAADKRGKPDVGDEKPNLGAERKDSGSDIESRSTGSGSGTEESGSGTEASGSGTDGSGSGTEESVSGTEESESGTGDSGSKSDESSKERR